MLMQVLDVDYFQNGNKPVIRIYGKTENGKSACFLYDKFLPYFFVDKTEENIKKLEELNLEFTVEKKFLPVGYSEEPVNLIKVSLNDPKLVPKIRELFKGSYSSDVLFKYRFMVDMEIKGMCWYDVDCVPIKTTVSKIPTFQIKSIKPYERKDNSELRFLCIDIECLQVDFNRQMDSSKDPIIMVSLAFFPKHKNQENLVLVAKPYSDKTSIGFPDEKEMLSEFLKIVEEYDPDIVTGYNIMNFDLPHILDRLKKYGLPTTLGRSDKAIFSRPLRMVGKDDAKMMTQDITIPGRVVFDAYQVIRRDVYIRLHRYNLATVVKELINEEKGDVSFHEIPKLWKGNLKRLVDYAKNDAYITMKLVLNKRLLDKFVEISKISGVLLQDSFGGQTVRIETLVMHEFKKRNMIMPLKPDKRLLDKRAEEKIKGATVLEPKRGYHKECILVLDFQSLYPSIIRAYNISPDSFLLTDTKLKYNTTPTGAKFVSGEVYTGVFPTIIKMLVETRQEVKREMKKAEGEEKTTLDAKQHAIKILANSFYGYCGYIRARLYVYEIASSITAYGRENIEKTKKNIETNFPVEVVYGDSITKDRFVTILDKNGIVKIKNIEDLFEENKEKVKMINGKARIILDGYKALTVDKITKQPIWSKINEIIRHKTNKKIYRVCQKFGETVVTEDHSLIINDNGKLTEAKATEILSKELARVETVPEVVHIDKLDMYELLKEYFILSVYKNRQKKAFLHKDDNWVWFGWTTRSLPVKMRRFIQGKELEALSRLIGAYISEGSSSTVETAVRTGASISSSDVEWLTQLQKDYQALFENTSISIIQSTKGIRELNYGNKTILYQDKTHKLQLMNNLTAIMFKFLCGQKSHKKRLPDFVFHLPLKYKHIILENMIKGDGSRKFGDRYSEEYSKNNFRYHTKSLELISGLSLLLRQIGIKYTIDYGLKKQVYRLTTCSDYNSNVKTRIIEELYDGYVYDLSVEDSHMFADSCGQILLHNTDSLFLKTGITDIEIAKDLGEQISKAVSGGVLVLEFEKIYKSSIILAKKRYAGWKFVKSDKGWQDKIEMKGIETVRRDWCLLVTETMNSMINTVLKEGDIKKATTLVKSVIDDLARGRVPVEKLAITKGITRGLKDYSGIQPHIELAKKLRNRNPTNPPKVGDRISYVIVKGKELLSKRTESVEYIKQYNLSIDPEYYIYNQVLPPIERILSSMGIERTELFGGGKQINLMDMLSSPKPTAIICSSCGIAHRRAPISMTCGCGSRLALSS